MKDNLSIPTEFINKHPGFPHKKAGSKFNSSSKRFKFFFIWIRKNDIAYAIRQIATLIQMHFPLDRTLSIVSDQIQKQDLKKIIIDLKQRIEKGESLAHALAFHKKYFPETVLKFAEIGEISGKLGDTLDQAASQLEKVLKLRRKLFTALSYPAIVIIVAIGAIGFLLAVVVPTFSDVFSDFGAQLPIATRMLVATGDFLVNYWYILFLFILGTGFLLRKLWNFPKARLRMERFFWKLPIVGPVIKKEIVTRFIQTLGMLLKNGILLPEAISISGKTSTNLNVEISSQILIEKIKSGQSFYTALDEAKIFPNMLVQMVRVGEEAGVISEMLEKSAEYYESEIDAAIETLNAVLEPVLIIGLGIIMGAIVIAMYWQIFNIVDVIQ